jgi:hypothetical protein
VVKLSEDGSLQWKKCFGGKGADFANSVQQTTDGGYIIAGRSDSNDGDVTGNHGDLDFWVVKLSEDGSLQWQKSFGGSGIDEAESIRQTADGGYIIAGNSLSYGGDVTDNHGYVDLWVVKLSDVGSLQWQKTYGGSRYESVFSVRQTSDGGYIIAGYTDSKDGDVTGNHGKEDFWVVKLSDVGSLQWQKTFGGSGMDVAYSIEQSSDGGYVVTGQSDSNDVDVKGNHGSSDFWVVKFKP